ncbi:hypothetical protein ACFV2Q_27625 [Streptomyces sp. NPDC059650]|uniref:hypothetical protein n=1 Tax=Streptomyces sp. NPDC059650 TaxID=3346896 RepID=UPI003686A72D
MTDFEHWKALQIRRPSDIPVATPLSWQADRASEHAMRIFDTSLPADFPCSVERGTAQDAVAELALRESIRRDVESGRGTRLHTALELGATWAEVAAALDISPDDARALLRQWADGQHHLYVSDQERGIERPIGFTPDQHAAVIALTERSDDEGQTAP